MAFHCVLDPSESQKPLTNSGNLLRNFGGNVSPQVTGLPLNYASIDCNWLDNNVFNVHMACAVVWNIFKFKTYSSFRLLVFTLQSLQWDYSMWSSSFVHSKQHKCVGTFMLHTHQHTHYASCMRGYATLGSVSVCVTPTCSSLENVMMTPQW